MDASEYQPHIDKLVGGLDGLLSVLDGHMNTATKNITKEQALELKDAFDKFKIDEKVQQIKRESFDLKNEFGI